MAHEELTLKLKTQIIEYLHLLEFKPEDIVTDAPLFGPESKIDLDSIDGIELSVLLEREYDIKITDSKKAKKVMFSVATMVAYIAEQGKG